MNYKRSDLARLYERVIATEDVDIKKILTDNECHIPRKRLEHLYEDVTLYIKNGEKYSPVGDVPEDIYRKVQRIASGKNTSGMITTYLNDKFYSQDSGQKKPTPIGIGTSLTPASETNSNTKFTSG